MKKLRSRKMANGRPNAAWNSTRPSTVSNRLRSLYSWNIGISAICSGTTSSATTMMKIQSRPGNSSHANA